MNERKTDKPNKLPMSIATRERIVEMITARIIQQNRNNRMQDRLRMRISSGARRTSKPMSGNETRSAVSAETPCDWRADETVLSDFLVFV